MEDASKFYAKEGQAIRPKLRALAEFAAGALNLSVAGPARLHQYANGRTVVFDPPRESFRGAFSVSMVGHLEIQVGAGTVNGVVPRMNGVRIDGLDEDGERVKTGIPKLKLSRPGKGLRSYVALRVELDDESGEMDAGNPDALQVVELRGLDAGAIAGGYPDDGVGVGYHPIAEAVWADRKRLVRWRRILYFNQSHIYLPGEEGRPGRHLFSPVS